MAIRSNTIASSEQKMPSKVEFRVLTGRLLAHSATESRPPAYTLYVLLPFCFCFLFTCFITIPVTPIISKSTLSE